MTATAEWSFRISLPAGWFTLGLDLPVADRRGALTRAVQATVDRDPELATSDLLMFDVAWAVAGEAVATGALTAAVGFRRCGDDLVVMASSAHSVVSQHPADLDALASAAAIPRPDDVTPRTVARVELPVGPAVRVHVIGRHQPSGHPLGAPVEAVDHFVPVPGSYDLLWLRCATPSVALGHEALATFDAMATSVVVAPPRPPVVPA